MTLKKRLAGRAAVLACAAAIAAGASSPARAEMPAALSAADARKGRVVELRFFGGLSVEETAEVLHVSTDTIKRDWRLAKLWLLRELEGEAR